MEETPMSKSEISSKSSARTRKEIMLRNPALLSDFKLSGRKLVELQYQYSVTADHTTKACIEAAIEKLRA
jgi:hypothetical protein